MSKTEGANIHFVAKTAKQYGISVGRLKNIMLEIYEKLFISSRDELAEYVLVLK